MAKNKFRYLSGPADEMQHILTQWASTGYTLTFHGFRCHAEIEINTGKKTNLISVMVELS